MAIVLPDAILGAPGVDYALIREWIIQKMQIIASIDLHSDTFQPSTGTQTSVLFAKKKTEKEIQQETTNQKMTNYDIFFAMVDNIGHDKRGAPIFKRDKDGNELFFEFKEDGIKNRRRILDDQTFEVVKVFLKWKKDQGIR
jgi:type I restriction enzyme M protein